MALCFFQFIKNRYSEGVGADILEEIEESLEQISVGGEPVNDSKKSSKCAVS
jgi:hypothetical protein